MTKNDGRELNGLDTPSYSKKSFTCFSVGAISVLMKRTEISGILRRHIKVPTATIPDQMLRFKIHLAFGTRIAFVGVIRVILCSHAFLFQIANLDLKTAKKKINE